MFLFFLNFQVYATAYDYKLESARSYCLDQVRSNLEVNFSKVPASMKEHFDESNLQNMLFPISRLVISDIGYYIQGMLDERDVIPNVNTDLRYLGRELYKKAVKENLTTFQKACLSNCLIKKMMSTSDDVFSTTSTEMALVNGGGFCRHFVLANEVIFKAANISYELGISLDHMFFFVSDGAKKLIFDPTNDDPIADCHFYEK